MAREFEESYELPRMGSGAELQPQTHFHEIRVQITAFNSSLRTTLSAEIWYAKLELDALSSNYTQKLG
jgi:hypothetical protein